MQCHNLQAPIVRGSVSPTSSTATPTSGVRHIDRIPAPPIEVKLFVGRVPKTHGEDDLRQIFEEFGTLRDIAIIRDRDTSNHKGCAFVRMGSITCADAVIRALNNSVVLDSSVGPLQVKYAFGEPERLGLPPDSAQPGIDQAKLFVGSLPKSLGDADIYDIFSRYGDVEEIFIMRDDKKVSRGCAFVRFAFKEEALNAIAHLDGKYTVPSGTRPIEVRLAENKKMQRPGPVTLLPHGPPTGMTIHIQKWHEYTTPDGRPYYYCSQTGETQWDKPFELDGTLHSNFYSHHPNVIPGGVGAQTHGPPGANVFLFHIPNIWSEHDLVSHFSPFGQIVSARIAADKSSGRRLGFGFVSFTTIEAAVQAVLSLNGLSVAGKRLKVTIKRGEEQYAAPFLPSGYASISTPRSSVSMSPQTPRDAGTGELGTPQARHSLSLTMPTLHNVASIPMPAYPIMAPAFYPRQTDLRREQHMQMPERVQSH